MIRGIRHSVDATIEDARSHRLNNRPACRPLGGGGNRPVWFSKFRILATAGHLGCLLVTPTFPEDGRVRLIDFPIEKIIIARPCMDIGPANLAAETARMLVWMLLLCRGVRRPAIGTAKKFGRPYVACHPAIMRRAEHVFQRSNLPRSMTYYSNRKISDRLKVLF